MEHRLDTPCSLFLILGIVALVAACDGGEGEEDMDGGENNMTSPDMGETTNNTTMENNTTVTTEPDMGGPVEDEFAIEECARAIPAATSGALCDVTAGTGDGIIIRATVLTDGKLYRNGSVLLSGSGPNATIDYVGCDASGEAGAAGATVIACANGVLTPGLINGHDHITFNANATPSPILKEREATERWDHRNDWRRGRRGSTRVPSPRSDSSNDGVRFSEIRHILAGTTSIAGSGGASGFTRNLDRASANDGLPGGIEVDYSTFPLGDTGGEQIDSGCGYDFSDNDSVLENTIYLPHVAEGIDQVSRNEFDCLTGADGGRDLIAENTTVVHGIGLNARDIQTMAARGAKLLWSPRSNMSLYGQTADVLTYRRFGVTIALGTDWVASGSMNILRELACAQYLNENHYDNAFSAYELWRMVTVDASVSMGTEDLLGDIRAGLIADLALFDAGDTMGGYETIVNGGARDVAMTMRGGEVIFGDANIVDGLRADSEMCDDMDECLTGRKLCATPDVGTSLAQLELDRPYELFFCDTPDEEPSCVPFRPGEYDGMASDTDPDGDGVPDATDNCPAIFNPARPLESDQPNFDSDAPGDSCDVCPLDADTDMCSGFDPNDRDGDTIANDMDNCPNDVNMGQEDGDMDGVGDVCDECPGSDDAAGVCPSTIYAIARGEVANGTNVRLENVSVTGTGGDGFFIQVPDTSPDYTGVEYSGLFVFTRDLDPLPSVGDVIDIEAPVGEFNGGVQLVNVTAASITDSMAGTPIEPEDVTLDEILVGGAKGDTHVGVLVRVQNVTVDNVDNFDNFGEIALQGGLIIDDGLFKPETAPLPNDTYSAVVGSISFRTFGGGTNRINPRSAADLQSGPGELDALEPSAGFVEQGSTLDVDIVLTAPAESALTITLSYGTGLSGPAMATVGQGDTRTTIQVTGDTAQALPVEITANEAGNMATASVIVFDETTPTRTVAALMPAMLSVAPGMTTDVTATIDVPAGAAGQDVMLTSSNTASFTVPAMVTVPPGDTEVTFQVTATMTEGMGTLEAFVTAAGEASAPVSVSAGPAECLIFSEVVEGSSNNKAFEIFNCGTQALDLTQYKACQVNNDGTDCRYTITLSTMLAPGAVRAYCNSSSAPALKANCDEEPGGSIMNFNGDDRLILFKDGNGDDNALDASDEILDVFGEIATRAEFYPNDTWQRCNQAPFGGLMPFTITDFFESVGNDTFTDLGAAPTKMACP